MAAITQAGRLMQVSTTLPYDVLLIDNIDGVEEISRPFRFDVGLLADVQEGQDQKVDVNKLVGGAISVAISLHGGGTRYLNGMVRTFIKEQQGDRFASYRAEVVPWFLFLDLRANCRIFQNKTVPDIVTAMVGESGFNAHFRSDLSKTYTARDYCVQYRETDFTFISRLLESEGIAYYFEHKNDGSHTMVLADSPEAFKDCPNEASFRYDPEVGIGEYEDTIRSWSTRQHLLSGKWMMRDHQFQMPTNTLEVPEDSVFANDVNRNLTIYDYPGDYSKLFNAPDSRLGNIRPEGEKLVRIRMEEQEVGHVVIDGGSHCRAMACGHTATVLANGAAGIDGKWLFISVRHSATQHPDYATQGRTGDGYSNSFQVIDSARPFHPARITPKPVVHGPQTGVVVDENPTPSEDIWPDKFGRVRVRFHWDRENISACWVRVAQAWAGRAWGQQWIPRVGDEVIIAFLEGDPDSPIIVGSVYNHDNMPVFTLPDHKTQSGLLTRSSPGGGSEDYNMIRLEDKAGSEEIFVHAQKALNTSVEADESRSVGGSRTTTVAQDDTRTVEKGKDELTVKKGDRNVTISMGNRTVEISKGNDSLKVDLGGITVQAPAGTHKTQALQIELDGTAGIKLSCGASSIELNPAMITITSPLVKIN